MSKLSTAILDAREETGYNCEAYVQQVDSWRVVIRADGTGDRRQRAAQISALRRNIERRHGCKLTYDHTNYSETAGFKSRTEIWYRIPDLDAKFEAREFSNDPEFKNRGGLVCITVYPTRDEAEAHKAKGNRYRLVVEVRD